MRWRFHPIRQRFLKKCSARVVVWVFFTRIVTRFAHVSVCKKLQSHMKTRLLALLLDGFLPSRRRPVSKFVDSRLFESGHGHQCIEIYLVGALSATGPGIFEARHESRARLQQQGTQKSRWNTWYFHVFAAFYWEATLWYMMVRCFLMIYKDIVLYTI